MDEENMAKTSKPCIPKCTKHRTKQQPSPSISGTQRDWRTVKRTEETHQQRYTEGK